jgi:hypothetical protein
MKVLSKNIAGRLSLLFALMLCFSAGKAQETNPTYDLHRLHFGFSIIGNYGKLKYSTSTNFMENDTIQQINTKSFPGFGVGGIMNVKLAEYWDFRTMVNIQFVERHLEYNFRGGEQKIAKLSSTYMEIPFLLKYKSKRNHK